MPPIKNVLKILGLSLTVVTSILFLLYILSLIIVNTVGLFIFGSENLCGNETIQEIYSPNELYKVVIFERNCGATADFSTQVSLLLNDDDLPSDVKGNIFSMKGHPTQNYIDVVWEANNYVHIQYDDSSLILFQESEYNIANYKIEISYSPLIEN